MHTMTVTDARMRRRRKRYTAVNADTSSEVSSTSRPNTRDGHLSSSSRLSADSGAGSLEDCHRRDSTPIPTTYLDYWDGLRRHTAPPRKSVATTQTPDPSRPNTVHAWDITSRSALSRYSPLPGIGIRRPGYCGTKNSDKRHKRRYCFQDSDNVNRPNNNPDTSVDSIKETELQMCSVKVDGDKDIRLCGYGNFKNKRENLSEASDDDNMLFQQHNLHGYGEAANISSALYSLNVGSDTDSDFDEGSELCVVSPSEEEEDTTRQRRPLVRSATFTIEKRPEDPKWLKLLLAVRLPDGSRVSGYFSSQDTLRSICEFASQSLKEPLERYELVTTDVPKRVFTDFSMSLQAAGIEDKTLLNLQNCDDSDTG